MQILYPPLFPVKGGSVGAVAEAGKKLEGVAFIHFLELGS
jgi:hypothetical protein